MRDFERNELFARARLEASPTEADRGRVRVALTKRLATAAVVTVSATAAKAAAATWPMGTAAVRGLTAVREGLFLSTGVLVKAAAVVVAIGAVVVTSTLPARRPEPLRTHAAPVVAAGPAPRTRSFAALGVPLAPSALASPRSSVPESRLADPTTTGRGSSSPSQHVASPGEPSRRPLSPSTSPATSPSTQPEATQPMAPPTPPGRGTAEDVDEVELISEVQSALRRSDAARALALLSEHERRFPNSALAPERDGARVLAVCAGAPPEDARRLGQKFLDAHPLSPLGGRVRATCGISEAPR
jgi:hypothetical protein